MKINTHEEKLSDTGEDITAFEITTNKGLAYGFLHKDQIVVHHICGGGCVKGIMNALVQKFKTNKYRFTMITNPNLKNIIKGRVEVTPANQTPYGEPVENIIGEWQTA